GWTACGSWGQAPIRVQEYVSSSSGQARFSPTWRGASSKMPTLSPSTTLPPSRRFVMTTGREAHASPRVVLVTGSSRGIGAALARRFGADGYRVAVHYSTSANAAGEVLAGLRAAGADADAFGADISDPGACQELVKAVTERFGSLDVLVNNAGITRDTLVLRMKDDDWRSVIDTNLSAAFYLSRAALRGMLKSGTGRIINISSVVALMGNAGQANYIA